MSNLLIRQAATQAAEVRFRGHLRDFKARNSCLHMAHFTLRAMQLKIPRLPPVRGLLSARKAMAAHGFETMADVLDWWGLPRIAPAMMLPGDIAWRAVPEGEEHPADPDRWGGLLICVGPHKLMGWFGNPDTEDKMVVMDMSFDQLTAAWRACLPSSQ